MPYLRAAASSRNGTTRRFFAKWNDALFQAQTDQILLDNTYQVARGFSVLELVYVFGTDSRCSRVGQCGAGHQPTVGSLQQHPFCDQFGNRFTHWSDADVVMRRECIEGQWRWQGRTRLQSLSKIAGDAG